MNKIITLLLFCLTGVSGFSQELKLSDGNNTKTFKKGSLFEVVIAEKNMVNDTKCCDSEELTGEINSIDEDSLTLRLSSYKKKKIADNVKIEADIYSPTVTINITIPQDKIYYLKNYKSLKRKKVKDGFLIAGGMLLFTGAATALNALIVNDKDSKNNLLISGGSQIGLGIGFLISYNTKRYYLSHSENIWTIKQ